MFDQDHSASRGMMSSRKLIVFKHDSKMGSAPSWKLFDLIRVQKKAKIAVPRTFGDYQVSVDSGACPRGVEIIEMI